MTDDIRNMLRLDGASYDQADMDWLIETIAADLATGYDDGRRPGEFSDSVEDVLGVLFARGLDPTMLRRMLERTVP